MADTHATSGYSASPGVGLDHKLNTSTRAFSKSLVSRNTIAGDGNAEVWLHRIFVLHLLRRCSPLHDFVPIWQSFLPTFLGTNC
jgi:hypothetical protein